MSNLPIDPIPIMLGLATALALLLYLREYNLRLKSTRAGEKMLEETEQKAFQLLHQAIKKAQTILSMAELEGIKLVAGSKVSSGKLDKEMTDQLSQSIQNTQTAISKEIAESQKSISLVQNEFIKFLNELRVRSDKLEASNEQLTRQLINQVFERLEGRLTDFMIQTEQKTTSSIELELKSARQLIETYKAQQLNLIDENILAMMEQTLSLVLSKKLSLKDQLDLVYEALEKAKVEKFII